MEFNCSVRNYTDHGLEMFIGDNTKIFPIDEANEQGRIFIQSLHRGEFYATVEPAADNCTATSCEGTGIFWMVANNRTLPLMDFFWCRATHNGLHEDSNRAFVEVLYPKCEFINRTMSLATTNKPVNVTTVTKGIPNSDTPATTNNGSNIRFTFSIFLLLFLCMLA